MKTRRSSRREEAAHAMTSARVDDATLSTLKGAAFATSGRWLAYVDQTVLDGAEWTAFALKVLNATDGKELASLTFYDDLSSREPMKPKELAWRVAQANRFLRDLGFSAPSPTLQAPEVHADGDAGDEKVKLGFSAAHLGVVIHNGTARLVRRDQVVDEHTIGERPEWAYYWPGGDAVVLYWRRGGRKGGGHALSASGLVIHRAPGSAQVSDSS
jgi:hypothetical protein